MEQVYWTLRKSGDVWANNDWLSAADLAQLGSFRIPKRRDDWRLGRWTAKNAVATYLRLPFASSTLAAIEIRPAASGAPELFVDGRPAPLAISLTHRGGSAACVIAPERAIVGCDLELIEPHSKAFVADYFTLAEQHRIAEASETERSLVVAILWSAKESTLKGLREGLRIDTRQVEVSFGETAGAPRVAEAAGGWRPLCARFADRPFAGWWQRAGGSVLTVVGEPGLQPPLQLPAASLVAHPG